MKTIITVEVDMDKYQLGNKYEAVTFKITYGRGMGNEGKGNRFNTDVEEGDTLIWTGEHNKMHEDINQVNYKVEIREISSKEELGYLNLFESIKYNGKEATSKIKKYELPKGSIIKNDAAPKGSVNPDVAIELYNITIRVTVDGYEFPDFTIDPVLTIHI